jgi:hypothetical protein
VAAVRGQPTNYRTLPYCILTYVPSSTALQYNKQRPFAYLQTFAVAVAAVLTSPGRRDGLTVGALGFISSSLHIPLFLQVGFDGLFSPQFFLHLLLPRDR